VAAYARALGGVPQGAERVGAVRDGLADFYVRAGRLDEAEALFEQRHEEDQGDVAVALSASRAFLAAGSISHAVRWLGIGAVRAASLGRDELASRLRSKQERVRERLS
jgi:pentatricopeptide repeat protein